MMQNNKTTTIILAGNPNVGKSTIFNNLCGKNQKTANYSGVTVDRQSGCYEYKGQKTEIIDLPGTYSIYPSSEDEAIFTNYLINEEKNYSGVIYIADALNLKRSLLLFEQIKDLRIPTLLVINQIDVAEKNGVSIDKDVLENLLGCSVILSNANKNLKLLEIKEAVFENQFCQSQQLSFEIPLEQKELVGKIGQQIDEKNRYKVWTLLAAESYLGRIKNIEEKLQNHSVNCIIPKRLQFQEITRRYQNIDAIISKVLTKKETFRNSLTKKIDHILLNNFFGYIFFFILLLLVFQCVYFLAEYPMDWIESAFSFLSQKTERFLPEGPLNSLISKGIIPGISGIVIFAPQIGILLYILYVLEDSGYMSRVIYLTDQFLRPFGLNGKSIVPLASGTACAIPAIISTRNIENTKERLITILVTPFITCSARLPVYSIIIGIIISNGSFFGIKYKALALMGMYLLGFITSLLAAFILKLIIKTKEKSYLVINLPIYRTPRWANNFWLVSSNVWNFIFGAGKIIFAVSIILWTLSYFGSKEKFELFSHNTNVELKDSYLGDIGKSIEPVIAPLGYDWKMGISILSSFAAREVFVGTLNTLYSLEEDEKETKIIERLREDVKPNGEKVFNLATGFSILFFYAFALQCISTVATVYRETQSKLWTSVQFFSMFGLAYLASLLIYQTLK